MLPEKIEMAVYGPEDFGTGKACKISENDPCAKGLLLQNKIRLNIFGKGSLALEEPLERKNAALTNGDLVTGVTPPRRGASPVP